MMFEYKVAETYNTDFAIETKLNQLAKEGWELVSTAVMQDCARVNLILKRPLK
jgi:hypothetical protein